MDFLKYSYNEHENRTFDRAKLKTWSDESTVDYWRHRRMYENLMPLANHYPEACWLTIGDGRYGTDAHFLESLGLDVLATDINTEALKIARSDNYIQKYKKENAENLTFDDGEFDFVLCKESYHHFPKPMVALYEMLRVARIGVVLIEPNDDKIINPYFLKSRSALKWLIQSVKNVVKISIGKSIYYHYGNYEPVGNYVYTISEREIEKVALGLNYDLVAFKGLNDHYIEGVEYERVDERGPLYREVLKIIREADSAAESGLRHFGILIAIIFKDAPKEEVISVIQKIGFRASQLTKNPFAK